MEMNNFYQWVERVGSRFGMTSVKKPTIVTIQMVLETGMVSWEIFTSPVSGVGIFCASLPVSLDKVIERHIQGFFHFGIQQIKTLLRRKYLLFFFRVLERRVMMGWGGGFLQSEN